MDLPSGKLRKQEEEAKPGTTAAPDRGVSKWKLALGAASLFFFVVGVKRSFRTEDGREILKSDADLLDEQRAQARLPDRGQSSAKASGSPATRARSESSRRPAGGGRLGSLLERAERESRPARPGGKGLKAIKDTGSDRTRGGDTGSSRRRRG